MGHSFGRFGRLITELQFLAFRYLHTKTNAIAKKTPNPMTNPTASLIVSCLDSPARLELRVVDENHQSKSSIRATVSG
jgi:hypothetical protein